MDVLLGSDTAELLMEQDEESNSWKLNKEKWSLDNGFRNKMLQAFQNWMQLLDRSLSLLIWNFLEFGSTLFWHIISNVLTLAIYDYFKHTTKCRYIVRIYRLVEILALYYVLVENWALKIEGTVISARRSSPELHHQPPPHVYFFWTTNEFWITVMSLK